jgi:hypothetical protein
VEGDEDDDKLEDDDNREEEDGNVAEEDEDEIDKFVDDDDGNVVGPNGEEVTLPDVPVLSILVNDVGCDNNKI